MRAINEVTLEWLHSFFAGGLGRGGSLGWLFISPVGALMCSHVEYCWVLVCHPSWSTYAQGHYKRIICAWGGGASKMQMVFISTTLSSDSDGEINCLTQYLDRFGVWIYQLCCKLRSCWWDWTLVGMAKAASRSCLTVLNLAGFYIWLLR